MKRGSQEGEWR